MTFDPPCPVLSLLKLTANVGGELASLPSLEELFHKQNVRIHAVQRPSRCIRAQQNFDRGLQNFGRGLQGLEVPIVPNIY